MEEKEHSELKIECERLENRAKALSKREFMESNEGTLLLKKSLVSLVLSKVHSKLPRKEAGYLYQMSQQLSKLSIFSIPKKERKTYEVDFPFASGMGFCHVASSFYLGGGYHNGKDFSKFRKVLPNGEYRELD